MFDSMLSLHLGHFIPGEVESVFHLDAPTILSHPLFPSKSTPVLLNFDLFIFVLNFFELVSGHDQGLTLECKQFFFWIKSLYFQIVSWFQIQILWLAWWRITYNVVWLWIISMFQVLLIPMLLLSLPLVRILRPCHFTFPCLGFNVVTKSVVGASQTVLVAHVLSSCLTVISWIDWTCNLNRFICLH